ncbi:MAG: hypothetical protein ISS70_05120 [Phycisphaerae bacterium]|nr:hypothetical protein [Phycisphaerae bacterium]
MNSNAFPHAENSVPAWDIDLPPNNVFVATVSMVGDHMHLVESPDGIKIFIKKELTDAGVELAETGDEAKMRLICTVTLNPVHESRVLTESLQPNTEYSSIVVEIQLTQEHDQRLRQPYYDSSGISVEPNEDVMAGIKNCLDKLLQKLTRKKDD